MPAFRSTSSTGRPSDSRACRLRSAAQSTTTAFELSRFGLFTSNHPDAQRVLRIVIRSAVATSATTPMRNSTCGASLPS